MSIIEFVSGIIKNKDLKSVVNKNKRFVNAECFYNENENEEERRLFFNKKSMEEEVQQADKENCFVIDVRTQEEFKQGHIPGAMNVPLDLTEVLFAEKFPDKDKKYLLYCHSGGRSALVCNFLKHSGYKNICNLGGIMNWKGKLEK